MKEKFIDRLFLFLEKQGGVYQVAEKMEMSPQNFYNMKRRNSLPNLTMIYSLKDSYPDLDMEWLLFGSKADTRESKEVEKLKEKLAFTEHLLRNASGWKETETAQRKSFKPDAVNPQQEIIGDPYKWTIKSAIMQGVPVADQKNMNSQWFLSPIFKS